MFRPLLILFLLLTALFAGCVTPQPDSQVEAAEPPGPPPLFRIGWNPEDPRTGETIRFQVVPEDPSDPVAHTAWNFGDGTGSRDLAPQKTYREAGYFPLSIQLETAGGHQTTLRMEMLIREWDGSMPGDGGSQPPPPQSPPSPPPESGSAGSNSSAPGNESMPQGNETETQAPLGDGPTYKLQLSAMRWHDPHVRFLIVPPGYGSSGSPLDDDFTRAVTDSIVHWEEMLQQYGETELRDEVHFEVAVLGVDVPDLAAVTDVDILVINTAKAAVLGGLAFYGLSPRCVALNLATPVMDDYHWMFYVSAHEVGHCLGMSHPDDHQPWQDVMSYDYMHQPANEPPPDLHCASNLNLRVIEQAFEPAFGRQPAAAVEIHSSLYVIYEECAQRFLD